MLSILYVTQIKVIPEFGSSSTFITYPAPYKIEQSVNVYEQLLVAGSTGVVKFEVKTGSCFYTKFNKSLKTLKFFRRYDVV